MLDVAQIPSTCFSCLYMAIGLIDLGYLLTAEHLFIQCTIRNLLRVTRAPYRHSFGLVVKI